MNCMEHHKKLINQPFSKHFRNGLQSILVLWLTSRGKIHGYGVMKELDKFFEIWISSGYIKESSPSKIYPLLKKLEDSGLIEGEWDVKDNKKVKYYQITNKGNEFLEDIRLKWVHLIENPLWFEFLSDIIPDFNSYKENKNEICN